MTANAPKPDKPGNSLLAAVQSNLAAQEASSRPADPPSAEKAHKRPRSAPHAPEASARSRTVLVGGHFAPVVLKQLRIIAAEEGTTNQALLAEALDLLFVKKGKARIERL